MTNGEKFRKIFKEFATEVWAFPEKDFLTWLNAEYNEPTTKNNLGVEEITALAEWTEKLTKASEDAYNKGYADGMKAQAEPKTKIEESNFSREQYALDIDTAWKCGYEAGKKENSPINICPHCGEYIGEEE